MKAITYNRKLNVSRCNLGTIFVDVCDPRVVVFEVVGRYSDNLHVAFGKVRSSPSNFSKLGSADRGEITRVGKQDSLRYHHRYHT
jgi:hypothetical protein